jgi:hypothetical protein
LINKQYKGAKGGFHPPLIMATKSTTKNLPPLPQSSQPQPFSLGEQGYNGLNIFGGISQDEIKRELTFPTSINTFKKMAMHSAVAAPLSLFDTQLGKIDWKVQPPDNPTKKEQTQTQFIRDCMRDMEHSFSDFIRDAASANQFGFSVHEKVFRYRTTEEGSMFTDGKIGWRKLPIRSQETIHKFLFSSDGNDLIGVEQAFPTSDPYGRYSNRTDNPRLSLGVDGKAMLFRVGKHRGDPCGKSPLRDAYTAWQFLAAIESIEGEGVNRDLKGLPILKIPPQYMSADATPEQKAIYENYKNALRNLSTGQQSGMILPMAWDSESKSPLFSLELLNSAGAKSFDTTKIKDYYKNAIYTAMSADILIMGQSATGSFALGAIKNSLVGAYMENMVKSILQVINDELIKQTYRLNGWDETRMCSMYAENLEAEDTEALSKLVQRVCSVGALEIDRPVLNRVRRAMNVDELPDDLEPQLGIMPGFTSKSGSGMANGTVGEGTATSLSGGDTSASNADNTA